MAVGGVRMRCGLGCLTRWADQVRVRWAVVKVFGRPGALSGCGDGTRSVRVGSGLSPVPLECSRTGPLRFLAGGGPVCLVRAVR